MIGIIGYGNMGKALAEGFGENVLISSRSLETSNIEVVKSSDYLLICVKPKDYLVVADEIKPYINEKVIVSITPNYTISELEEMFGTKRIVRLMPSTAVAYGEGVIVGSSRMDVGDLSMQLEVLGKVYWVEEDLVNASIGLAGSGIAFIYEMLEAMGQGGIYNGFKAELAYELVAQTMVGAARMYQETKKHPAKLRDEVSSPKGVTIKGLQKLHEGGFKKTVMDAVIETNK